MVVRGDQRELEQGAARNDGADRHAGMGVLEAVEVGRFDADFFVQILLRIEDDHRGDQLGQRRHRRGGGSVLLEQNLAGLFVDDDDMSRLEGNGGPCGGAAGEQQ